MKKCPACGKIKILSEFSLNITNPDGFQTECKVCAANRDSEYRRKNKEKNIKRLKEYRKNNKDKTNECRRKWVGRNKEYHKHAQKMRNKLFYQVKIGKVKKEHCLVCGNVNSEAHHYMGYDDEYWDKVIWLCKKHHAVANVEKQRKRGIE